MPALRNGYIVEPKDTPAHHGDVEATAMPTARADIDPEIEKRVLKKLDRRVVPLLALLYLLAFLDRSNIGFA